MFFIFFELFVINLFVVFFFKQNTAYDMRISDWSSDVCSSDLALPFEMFKRVAQRRGEGFHVGARPCVAADGDALAVDRLHRERRAAIAGGPGEGFLPGGGPGSAGGVEQALDRKSVV